MSIHAVRVVSLCAGTARLATMAPSILVPPATAMRLAFLETPMSLGNLG
jgi:hypothetical protein